MNLNQKPYSLFLLKNEQNFNFLHKNKLHLRDVYEVRALHQNRSVKQDADDYKFKGVGLSPHPND